jgi:hypothetical protein
MVEGGRVDDHVRPSARKQLPDGFGVGDVGIGAGGAERLQARLAPESQDVGAELAVGTKDEHAHGAMLQP